MVNNRKKMLNFIPANKVTLTKEQRETVDSLLRKDFCRMFEAKRGKLFLVLDHWKYIKWQTICKRVLLCKGVKTEDGFYYSIYLV